MVSRASRAGVNFRIFPTQHLLSLLLGLVALSGQVCRAYPQSAAVSQTATVDQNSVDAKAFATLFRRVNTFEKMAKEAAAKTPDKPEAKLNQVMPTRFKLAPDDKETLLRVATDWEKQVAPLRAQMVAAIQAFHSSLANSGVGVVDDSPPPVLKDLQGQIDAVTLRHRDALQNQLRPADFDRVAAETRKIFSRALKAGGQIAVPVSGVTP